MDVILNSFCVMTILCIYLCVMMILCIYLCVFQYLQSRLDILKIHSRRMNLMRGIDLKKIAEKMNGASGAELKVWNMNFFFFCWFCVLTFSLWSILDDYLIKQIPFVPYIMKCNWKILTRYYFLFLALIILLYHNSRFLLILNVHTHLFSLRI